MRSVRRRAAYYVLFIGALILVASVGYDLAMKTFEPGPYPPEGTDVSLLHSMQVVVETFTATGYGSDSPWQSAELNLLVVLLDLTGVALFFLALPAVLVPLFREALTPSAPTEIDDSLSDHVVVCTYSERIEALVDELAAHDVGYVLVEPDDERAIELDEAGHDVLYGDPASIDDLQQAGIARSRALVADITDRADASVVLAAREVDESVRIVSVVEDPDLEPYHRLAGADEVSAPRQILGQSLADKLTTAVSTDLGDAVEIGADLEIAEVPIRHGSELHGQPLAESGLREQYGINVLGAWIQGDFESSPPPDTRLESGSVLLVSGNDTHIEQFQRATLSTAREARRGETIVVGYGEVGQTVARRLAAADLPFTVVDNQDRGGVDVVGDGTDPEVLQAAGIDTAASVVLALPDETSTEFATLVARDCNEDVELIARADGRDAVRKTYRAGADYVLSLSTVSGRSIAASVLDREEILSIGTGVEVIRTTAPGLAGSSLASARVRERTGCTVVAIERDGDLLTDVSPDFRMQTGDELVIAGTNDGTTLFTKLFG